MTRKTPSKATGNPTGRPTRAEAARRLIQKVGVDPDLVDPRRILAGIAADETAPASARVAAAKALIISSGGLVPVPPSVADEPQPEVDELTRRSLILMTQRGRPN